MIPRKEIIFELPEERKGFYQPKVILFPLLKGSLSRCLLQISRIKNEVNKAQQCNVDVLHADIHFFFIAVRDLVQISKKMAERLSSDSAFVYICEQHLPYLEQVKPFRHNLEHITVGRIDGRGERGIPLVDPQELGNYRQGKYYFGGEQIDLDTLSDRIIQMHQEIVNWCDNSADFKMFSFLFRELKY